LKNTSLDRLDPHETGLLHGYVTLRGERIDTTDNTFTVGNPAAGAVSRTEDLNLLMAGIFQGRELPGGDDSHNAITAHRTRRPVHREQA
jgi:D-alanyl-D-alanine carboxypeptidase